MELMLRDGDYVRASGGGLKTVTGTEELLQRVLFQLSARRGSFPLLPEVGSRLWKLSGAPVARRADLAREYVAEALAGERDLEVTGVTLTEETGAARLEVRLNWKGTALSVEKKL